MRRSFRAANEDAGRHRERRGETAQKSGGGGPPDRGLGWERGGAPCSGVRRGARTPPIPSLGRKPFTDREVKELLEAIPKAARYPLRERAIMTLQLSTPIRPDEVRRLLVRDLRESDRRERGHLIVRAAKTEAGTGRVIPLDPEAETAIRAYLRFERPPAGADHPSEFRAQEPLFLTHDGPAFTYFASTKRNQLLPPDLAQPA